MKLTMLPNKKIREKSKKVTFPLTKEKIEIIQGMIDHINDSQLPESNLRAGVGIAAVQVGHLDRMFYINAPAADGEKEWKEFLINPVINKIKNTPSSLAGGEGCLSVSDDIPLQDGYVHRGYEVTITGYSYFQGKEITVTKKGYQAIIIQHEQDHLNGMLFIDRINKFEPWKTLEGEIII